MSQRMTLITSPVFIPEARLKQAGSFAALFGNDNPLCLEIGCHPQRNFIAIDIFNQGCRQTCSRIEESGLQNILMMRIEARYLMYQYLGAESLQAIYINCPDPWPKKRHRKRRLLNHEFLNLALYCLRPAGELHFATDFADYGETAGELLNSDERFKNMNRTSYTHELRDYPISKYMRRFLDQGQPIYFCHYQKRPGVQVERPKLAKGFRLRWSAGASA